MIFKFFKSGVSRVKDALKKTRDRLGGRLRSLFSGPIDEEVLEEVEQLLYEADLGVKAAQEITGKLLKTFRRNPSMTADDLIQEVKKDLIESIPDSPAPILTRELNQSPLVILIVGVNGNGKTSSIAKLAKRYQTLGKSVLLGAGDTFRAAAIDQLEIWAHRIGVDLVKTSPGSDPAALAFDAVSAAVNRSIDVVIIDTAGRLHTKTPLMDELAKIRRSCDKVLPGSPHETLLVLDATIGQNALDQAKTFHEYTPISGLILTKLDSSAKGGIAVSLHRELDIPIAFIGTGEKEDDFAPFDRNEYIDSLIS